LVVVVECAFHDVPRIYISIATRFEYPTTHKAALDTTLPATRVLAASTRVAKNFIAENALAVIMAEARRPVDTTLNYLEKADFGRTPAYLHKVQQEISAEKEYIRQVMAAEQEEQTKYQPKMKMLPEEEREKVSRKYVWEPSMHMGWYDMDVRE